ncbi:MAG: YciI family protein [Pseudomonadota bacterium]
MKFICLICAEQMMEDLEPDDAAGHFADYAAFTEAIKREGHFVSANRLQPAATAKTVRVRDGRTHVTDGPFAETRELVGGYYLIDAQDMRAALAIAARIPGAQRGCVEVRPIADDAPTRALRLNE